MSFSNITTNNKADNIISNNENSQIDTLSLDSINLNAASTLSLGDTKKVNPSDILRRALNQMEKAESAQHKEQMKPKTAKTDEQMLQNRDTGYHALIATTQGVNHTAERPTNHEAEIHRDNNAIPAIEEVNLDLRTVNIAEPLPEIASKNSHGKGGQQIDGRSHNTEHSRAQDKKKNKPRASKIDTVVEKNLSKYGIDNFLIHEEIDIDEGFASSIKKADTAESTDGLYANKPPAVRASRFVRAAPFKRRKNKTKGSYGTTSNTVVSVEIPDSISVRQLAAKMAARSKDVLHTLKNKLDMDVGLDDEIDRDIAELLAEEYNRKVIRVHTATIVQIYQNRMSLSRLSEDVRCPVVTIMGHVDHGKTSLLDAIRRSKLVDQESGSITQHVNAYKITTKDDKFITFIDTPGHAAFEAMRSRGANIADIALLIVAADEGIMPQTIESINHIKSTSIIPILVVTKMDKNGASMDKVKHTIAQYDLIPEEYGGNMPMIPISSHTGMNIDKLLAAIEEQASAMNLRSTSNAEAAGVVIDAKIDKIQGPSCVALVQCGTLKVGQIVACGNAYGKVKVLLDDFSRSLDEATISMPVEMIGLSSVPKAGDVFVTVKTEKEARTLVEDSVQHIHLQSVKANKETMDPEALKEALFANLDQNDTRKELNILLKVDVHGSIEAIRGILDYMKYDEVCVNIICCEVGNVSISDIRLAKTTNSLIFGFNVQCDTKSLQLAKEIGVTICSHAIIYNLESEIKRMLSDMLSPVYTEQVIGAVVIKEVFTISKIGSIAGCHVTDGEVQRGARVRLLRDKVVICEDKIVSVRKLKEEVKSAKNGHDCGIKLEKYDTFKVGDVISVYNIIATKGQI